VATTPVCTYHWKSHPHYTIGRLKYSGVVHMSRTSPVDTTVKRITALLVLDKSCSVRRGEKLNQLLAGSVLLEVCLP